MEYNPKYSSKLTPVLNIVEILILFLSGAAIIMGMVGVDLFTRVVIGPIALFLHWIDNSSCDCRYKIPNKS